MIAPMTPDRASATFTPNFPSSDAKPLSLFLIHYFRHFSSLGGGSQPDANNASTSTQIAILITVSMEAIIIPCSLNSINDDNQE